MARGGTTGPDLAEWVVAVSWLKALPREQAVKDSDFFANQTALSASRTGTRSAGLRDAFELDLNADADTAAGPSESAPG